MSESYPATVKLVSEAEATGRVAEIYQDIRQVKQIDFVPNFWQTLATNPALLESVWMQVKRFMHPEATGETSYLAPTTRELIALVVSATNGCAYCINSHSAALKKLGLGTAALGEALAIAGLFNMTNTIAEGYQIEPDVRPPIAAD